MNILNSIFIVLSLIFVFFFTVLPTLKDRIISPSRLLIAPLVFFTLFGYTIFHDFVLNELHWIIIFVGSIIGCSIGLFSQRHTEITWIHETKKIALPKTYLNSVVFIAIFFIHFVMGLTQNASPGTSLLLLAIMSTILLGANGMLWVRVLVVQPS